MSSASESDSYSSDSSSSSSDSSKGVALTPSKAVNKSVPLKKPMETLPLPANKGIAAEDESAEDDSDSQMVADASKQKKKKKGAREFDGDDSKTPNPKKKKSGEQVRVVAAEEGKKSAIKRVWSDQDEIFLLKGMIEFKEKNKEWDVDLFFNLIKKSLQLEVNKKQVTDKIRKTKIKYDKSVVNKRVFTFGHEKRIFDLSEKIWGKEAAGADVDPPTTKSNMKPASKAAASKDAKNGNAEGVKEVEADDSQSIESDDPGNVKANKEGGSSWQFIEKASIAMGLDENIVKAGLSICRDERKTELENKWKQWYVEESDLFLRKLDLASEGVRLINETLKSVVEM